MKNVYTVVGRPYAVTTAVDCTISTRDGVVIATCEPGYQVIFVAPCEVVCVSDDEAHVTETFSAAASAVSGGGMKRDLEEYIEQKTDENRAAFEQGDAELREALENGFADAGAKYAEVAEALSAHGEDADCHLQSGERERWNSLLPAGMIIPSACASVPGYLLCNGVEVSRSTYATLFAAIGTAFGEGDGSTTFNLPDLRGRTLWGAFTTTPIGTVKSAGLPEIAGYLSAYGYGKGSPYSAISTSIDSQSVLSYGTGQDANSIGYSFRASRSNSIYGNSSTVQPPALVVNFFIKY